MKNSYFKSPPFFITAGIIVFVGLVALVFHNKFTAKDFDTSHVKIIEKWDLPRDLEEVSGIAYAENDKIVCIQDEDGIIFIYNLNSRQVEHQVKFAEDGDYEGVALKGKKAFVVRSDGRIFQISDYESDKPEVQIFKTGLKDQNNVEGLCYDSKHDRLLLATKNIGIHNHSGYKGVYAFYLKTNSFEEEPVYKLKFDNPLFKDLRSFGKASVFRPSEISINPKTGDIYILDAEVPKLLILDENFKIKKLYHLNLQDFPQVEGLTFSPDGKTYISNETVWNPANILQVKIEEKTKSVK